MFKESRNSNFISKIREWFTRNKITTKGTSNPFDRYSRVKFHGIILFPEDYKSQLKSFIEESWQELNSLTDEWIDIYYSKQDIEERNCYDFLNNIKNCVNINRAELPALIIWDNDLKNSFPIPISDLENKKIKKLIAHIVDSIRSGKNLPEVIDDGIKFINEEKSKNKPVQTHINYMGDKIEINNSNVNDFTFKSSVKDSFNKNSDNSNENITNVIKEIGKIVEASGKNEAVELFKAFTEEMNKTQPSKPALKSFWNSLEGILPILSTTASIAKTIMEIIN
ncbi:hypothetical protein [Prevotella jejuni]